MTNNNSEDRLDRIETLLEVTVQGLSETRKLTESNSRAIESNTRNIAETKKITESNSRAIQAILDQRARDQLKHEQQLEEQRELNRKMTRYIDGLGKMMTNIDEDRPTILRKLTTIENKLDSLQIFLFYLMLL